MSTVLKETDNFIIFVPNDYRSDSSRLFCKVCCYILKTHSDTIAQEKYDCCHDCFLRFCESRKEEWLEGWRPKKEDLDKIRVEKDRIFIK